MGKSLEQSGLNSSKSGFNLEKSELLLGFVPLTDCAILAVAKEKGFFDKYGLMVTLSREPSWANIRDKVAIGALDGAQMLAGIPIASTLGINTWKKHTVTAFSMGLNGNAITISNHLYQKMLDIDPDSMTNRPVTAHALKKVIEQNNRQGKDPITFAHVFPVSSHNYQLRYWLASAGIDPDRDVRLVVVPPAQMPENIGSHIDGFCVGEPWNEYTVKNGLGKTLITGYEIWNNAPEKVFGVNREWAENHPNTHQAIICALLEAAQYLDKTENRMEIVELISQKQYVNAPVDIVKMSMTGTFCYQNDDPPCPLPDFNVFYRYCANFPWRSHAAWFITQMYRWGQLDQALDIRQLTREIYLPEVYRSAAAFLGIDTPAIDFKPEGIHSSEWPLDASHMPLLMGKDEFLDNIPFHPDQPVDYLRQFRIHNLKVSLDELEKKNS